MEIPGYRLGTVIGQGGMGRVYEGEQLTLRRRVAVKVLAPELMGDSSLITRFKLEVTLLGGLMHPNIVRVIDSGFTGSTFFYAMEYCEGGTLKSRLRVLREQERKYDTRQAVELACALLDGLEAVHQRKIVHRDIKPGNIFFAEDDRPVLGDFGLARDLAGTRLTIDPQAMGTPLYMSPEARLGENIDRRSDVFQIARVLYEMLSGEDPNTSAPIWLRLTHKSNVPDLSKSNPEVSIALAQAVTKALSWRASERPQTAAEFREMLLDADLECGDLSCRTEPVLRPDDLPTPAPRRDPTPPPRERTPATGARVRTSSVRPSAAATGSLRPELRRTGIGRERRPMLPLLFVGCALALGLSTGAWLFWPHTSGPAAPTPTASAGPHGDAPRVEGLHVEFPGPFLDLHCAPACKLDVVTGAGAVAHEPAASHHHVSLAALPPGRSALALTLDSGQASTVVTMPFQQPFSGMPTRHCLGIVLKECFDFAKHANVASTYDDALFESIGQAGPSAVTVLVDPERDDDGLIPLCRAYRKQGLEIDFSLYTNRYPAQPDEVAKRLSALIRLVAGMGQKQVYISPGILIDTIGWSEGWTRYRDYLQLVAEAGRDAPIPVHLTTGNMFARGDQSLTGLLQSGAGKFVNGVVTTHRYVLKCAPRPPAGLAPFESIALRFGLQRLDWVFDVSSPDDPDVGGGLLEHDLVGSVMADPQLRDVAASLDQRRNKGGQPYRPLAEEEELFGSRMRETARLVAAGALALWDQVLCADPADGNRLRLRAHPAGIRLMLDFMLTAGEEPQALATDSQRSRVGLEGAMAEGLLRESPAGTRLMLWSETTARQRVSVRTSQAVLITPLLQSARGPFVCTYKQPSGGRVEIPLGWSPVIVELMP